MRRGQYGSDFFDSRDQTPSRPSSQQSSYPQYDWYQRDPPSASSISYQPPPPVITEQPRPSLGPSHFQPFDRNFPKTLESLAEKVHTFHTGPRPPRQGGRGRMPRTGSDHRINFGDSDQPRWYGSMPRPRTGSAEYRGRGYGPGGKQKFKHIICAHKKTYSA